MWEFLVIYVVIGAAFCVLFTFGAGSAKVEVSILGRRIDEGWIRAGLLFLVFALWPLTLWLIISGHRKERASAKVDAPNA